MDTQDQTSDSSPNEVTATAATAASSTPSAAVATASANPTTISEHLAQTLQTLEQLTSIFSFPHHLSQLAIEHCGPEDVQTCYNWILDNHGNEVEDCGGPVVPKLDCPHVGRHVNLNLLGQASSSISSSISICHEQIMIEKREKNGQEGEEKEDKSLKELLSTGGIMNGECQHRFVQSKMKRKASRKRLRSEKRSFGITTAAAATEDNQNGTSGGRVGRLKCDEDYDMDNNTATINENQGKTDGTFSTSSTTSCPKGENWLCLECGAMLCSRYANGHARLHWLDTKAEEEEEETKITTAKTTYASGNNDYEKKRSFGDDVAFPVTNNNDATKSAAVTAEAAAGHCIAVSLADLSVWCYECNAYLQHPSLDALTRQLEKIKFGNDDDDGGDDENAGKTREKSGSNGTSGNGTNDATGDDDDDNMEIASNSNVNTSNDNDGVNQNSNPCTNDGNDRSDNRSDHDHDHYNDHDEDDYQNDSDNEPKASLLSGQVGTAIRAYSHHGQDSDANLRGSGDEEDNDDDSSGSDRGVDSEHQAAIIASLLQSEHAAAIRAYMARHESFDPGDMSQCVPMIMPKPPSFPDEMADFLRSPLCKSIIVLAGAGMSVSSGIPDFRSAGVGLYDTLRPELLTASELEQELIADEPTLALDKGMFLRNPLPMLELKRDFILGTHESRWKATLAHRFVELLHSKLGKLTRLYTQNIDGLELQCRNLPKEKIVNVHGSMGAAACELCEAEVDFDEFCSKIKSSIKDITGTDVDAPRESTPIVCEACGSPTVKPTIVLFRGSMPKEFHVRTAEDLPDCDLLIIMGTSLTVAPANSLVYRVPPTSLRMVMNNEKVGRRLGIDYTENSIRDVFAHGHSDEVCLDLAEKMGWLDDFEAIMDELPESSAQMLRDRLAERQED